MNFDTRAIVIKRVKVSSDDVLITIFSKDIGKKKVYINGGRNPKSRFSAASQVLVEGDFTLYLKKSLSSINSVNIVNSHAKIRDDLDKFFIASYILELVDNVVIEGDENAISYDFLSYALKYLEEESEYYLKFFRLFFMLKILKQCGFSPEVNFCTSCLSGENLNYFSAFSGGTLCEKCKGKYSDVKLLNENNKELIDVILNNPYINARKYKKLMNYLPQLDEIISEFLKEYILTKNLKSEAIIIDCGL